MLYVLAFYVAQREARRLERHLVATLEHARHDSSLLTHLDDLLAWDRDGDRSDRPDSKVRHIIPGMSRRGHVWPQRQVDLAGFNFTIRSE